MAKAILPCECPPHELVRDRRGERLLFTRSGICGAPCPRDARGQPLHTNDEGEPLCVEHQLASEDARLWTEETKASRLQKPLGLPRGQREKDQVHKKLGKTSRCRTCGRPTKSGEKELLANRWCRFHHPEQLATLARARAARLALGHRDQGYAPAEVRRHQTDRKAAFARTVEGMEEVAARIAALEAEHASGSGGKSPAAQGEKTAGKPASKRKS